MKSAPQKAERKERREAIFRLALIPALAFCFIFSSNLFLNFQLDGAYPAREYFPLDASYSSLVYASSFSRNARFEFSPVGSGAGPVSPLWSILESPFMLLSKKTGTPAEVPVFFLAPALAAALAICVYSWGRESFGGVAMGGLAAAAVTLDPGLCYSRFSGTEIVLCCCLLVSACHAWQEKKIIAASALSALASLTRPESAALLLLFVAFESRSMQGLKRRLTLVAPTLAVFAAWALFSHRAAGHFLPPWFRADLDPSFSFKKIYWVTLKTGFNEPYLWWGLGLIFYVIGAAAMVSRFKTRAAPAIVFPWAYMVLIACLWKMDDLSSYADHMVFQPCAPFLAAPWAAGVAMSLSTFTERTNNERRKKELAAALVLITLVLVVVVLYPWRMETVRLRALLAQDCLRVGATRVAMGKWIEANVGKDDAVAADEAGAIRYFGKRKTLDLSGKNDAESLADKAGAILKAKPALIVTARKNPSRVSLEQDLWSPLKLGPGKVVYLKPVFAIDLDGDFITAYKTSYEPPRDF